MIKFIETKKTYIMILAILFVVISLSSTTYSLFLKSDTTNTFNYNTGNLDLEFIEDKQITLDSAFPVDDSIGSSQEPYNLTIKNTGSLTYKFDLKMLANNDDNVIDNKYIKVKVNDNLPHNLFVKDNIIASDLVLQPGESLTFKINVWLDLDTPNIELGKKFIAKLVATGSAIYKNLDSSGANYPKLEDKMIPIYYDESDNSWKKADSSNMNENYRWYDYNSSIWANVALPKDSSKQIIDITRNNNLTINNPKINNGNLIIDNEYLDIGLSNYQDNQISVILRAKFKNNNHKVYFISNERTSYYYDKDFNKFVYTNGQNTVLSSNYLLNEDTWYVLGYTYDGTTLKFYANGNLISSHSLEGTINSNNSFKIGTDKTNQEVSNIILGDIYIYNNILSEQTIKGNYQENINIIYDNLLEGYNEFTPMTLKEYYLSMPMGTKINDNDISSYYVWIPRFKYKLWNGTGKNNIDSYNAYQNGIDISFEKGKSSSGTIYCENDICYSDELKTTKITENDNGKYYTHPAFTKKEEELTGFWVSKYEISLGKKNNIEIKAGNNVLTSNSINNYYQEIKKIANNYHLIKNTEWGAITYLSHSKYGTCQNNSCQIINPNNTFISGNNASDTTTNNIYGVYDMAGSATEFTMSDYSDSLKDLQLTNPLDQDDYDQYNNTFILGDATKELSLSEGSWYNVDNHFLDSTNSILTRGGIANQNNATIYNYLATNNINNNYTTTRIVIK